MDISTNRLIIISNNNPLEYCIIKNDNWQYELNFWVFFSIIKDDIGLNIQSDSFKIETLGVELDKGKDNYYLDIKFNTPKLAPKKEIEILCKYLNSKWEYSLDLYYIEFWNWIFWVKDNNDDINYEIHYEDFLWKYIVNNHNQWYILSQLWKEYIILTKAILIAKNLPKEYFIKYNTTKRRKISELTKKLNFTKK